MMLVNYFHWCWHWWCKWIELLTSPWIKAVVPNFVSGRRFHTMHLNITHVPIKMCVCLITHLWRVSAICWPAQGRRREGNDCSFHSECYLKHPLTTSADFPRGTSPSPWFSSFKLTGAHGECAFFPHAPPQDLGLRWPDEHLREICTSCRSAEAHQTSGCPFILFQIAKAFGRDFCYYKLWSFPYLRMVLC